MQQNMIFMLAFNTEWYSKQLILFIGFLFNVKNKNMDSNKKISCYFHPPLGIEHRVSHIIDPEKHTAKIFEE